MTYLNFLTYSTKVFDQQVNFYQMMGFIKENFVMWFLQENAEFVKEENFKFITIEFKDVKLYPKHASF